MPIRNIYSILNTSFQRQLFGNVIKHYGSSLKAGKELTIPHSSLRNYHNVYPKSVPYTLLKKLLDRKFVSKDDLQRHTILTFDNFNKTRKNFDLGRKKRRDYLNGLKANIPQFEEIITSKYLNLTLWFEQYKYLVTAGFRKLEIKTDTNFILVRYSNFTKNGFKNYEIELPKKIQLDADFIYFFGLWCGDRAGRGRFGITNQNRAINLFTEQILNKYHQRVEKILYVNKGMPDPHTDYNKKFIIDKEIKGWVLSVHSVNGIFDSFFRYIQENLSIFLSKIEQKNIFFAGLFDAEGNVSL